MQAPIWARLVIWSLVLGAFVVGVAGETVLASPSVGDISTVAGNGNLDFSGDGGQATAASFRFPSSIAVDGQGNLFIADKDNSRIRRVDASSGIITTVVGNGINGFSGDGGLATGASLNLP